MKRRKFSEKDVLETLRCSGYIIRCFRCGEELDTFDPAVKIQREHVTELALGGKDEPSNCAYSHKACHDRITNGTKATTAGSSKQRIAKVRRLRGENKPKMKRAWPAGRKLQSRPWPK